MVAQSIDVCATPDELFDNGRPILKGSGVKQRPTAGFRSQVGVTTVG
jgi:hypothetical protein